MSRQLDSLLKGLKVFEEGMTDFMTAKAINDTQKELDTAKITFGAREGMTPEQLAMEEENMMELKNNLAQRLSGKLAAIGAPAARIQAATSFGLTAPQIATLDQQARTQAAKDKRTTAAAEIKAGEDVKDRKFKLITEFQSQNKNTVEAIEKSGALLENIKANPDRIASINLAKTGLLKLAGEDRITDEDINRAGYPNSYLGKAYRQVLLETQNSVDPEERQFFMRTINVLRDKMITDLNEKARKRAETASKIDPNIDSDEFGQVMMGDLPYKTSRQQAVEAKVDAMIKSNPGVMDPKKRQVYIDTILKKGQ